MAYTLLKMTQYILSAMDSDEITDIADTLESQQVVDIIESIYNEIATEILLPEHDDIYKVDETSGTTPPVLTRPSNAIDMKWLKYNKAYSGENDNFEKLTPVDLDLFLERQDGLDESASNVSTYTFTTKNSDTYTFKYWTDRMPSYYTIIADHYIVCDAIYSTDESFLDTDKTMAFGKLTSTFTRSNSWTPDIDEYNFMMFFNACKAQCFADLKQTLNPKAERKEREGKIRSQKRKQDLQQDGVATTIRRFPNFGRK